MSDTQTAGCRAGNAQTAGWPSAPKGHWSDIVRHKESLV